MAISVGGYTTTYSSVVVSRKSSFVWSMTSLMALLLSSPSRTNFAVRGFTVARTKTTFHGRNLFRLGAAGVNGEQQQRQQIPRQVVSRPVASFSTQSSQKQKPKTTLTFHDTPLGRNGTHLLSGLDVYTVPASTDGHPLAVYGIDSQDTTGAMATRKPILLLHGRTWSSVPVYHLMGWHTSNTSTDPTTTITTTTEEQQASCNSHQSRSMMETLVAKGLQPYCMDFRGFGGTPVDPSGVVEPLQCVADTETVLQWMHERHSSSCSSDSDFPALLGWSQGALVAQLAAQRTQAPLLSKLILYGSIYDPLVRYPREPLYASATNANNNNNNSTNHHRIPNDFDDAISDFTIEGTIPPEPARLFAEAALVSDPYKAAWHHLYQFNTCDPARVHVPCLVVAGDQDPYASLHVQQELFCALGRASDRTWSILSESDHAVHLLDGRERLINTVVSFVQNGKRSEQTPY